MTKEGILKIYNKSFMELIYEAATIHRKHHDPNTVQISTLISIKTGGCPEDCGYCPQAARYQTPVKGNDLMSVNQVKAQALRAKAGSSSRICMGAAWRNVKDGAENTVNCPMNDCKKKNLRLKSRFFFVKQRF